MPDAVMGCGSLTRIKADGRDAITDHVSAARTGVTRPTYEPRGKIDIADRVRGPKRWPG